MKHRDLLARLLFSGDAGRGLRLQRTGRFDRNLGVVERLHNSVTGGLVALLAFLVGVGANFVDECFGGVCTSIGNTGNYRNSY